MKILETIGGIVIVAAVIAAIFVMAGVDVGPFTAYDDRADLRLISQPYLEATGVKDTCLASGATWHEDRDFVGCVGMGPNSCSSDIVLSGQTQCIGAGANWFCETGVQGAVYCAYEPIVG